MLLIHVKCLVSGVFPTNCPGGTRFPHILRRETTFKVEEAAPAIKIQSSDSIDQWIIESMCWPPSTRSSAWRRLINGSQRIKRLPASSTHGKGRAWTAKRWRSQMSASDLGQGFHRFPRLRCFGGSAAHSILDCVTLTSSPALTHLEASGIALTCAKPCQVLQSSVSMYRDIQESSF